MAVLKASGHFCRAQRASCSTETVVSTQQNLPGMTRSWRNCQVFSAAMIPSRARGSMMSWLALSYDTFGGGGGLYCKLAHPARCHLRMREQDGDALMNCWSCTLILSNELGWLPLT